jgi:hypothetical protein
MTFGFRNPMRAHRLEIATRDRTFECLPGERAEIFIFDGRGYRDPR